MEYGRYKILSQLGQGGMATVYLSEDPLLQRLVAIKVIQAHLSTNNSLIDRFNVEAKTIAALRHVNIVEVFDFGIQDDQQYLVMEYVDGQNLQALCTLLSGQPMPNEVAAAIICQATEGLTSAERHGVVHRDIKPENLMFNAEGVLKIADFGIAHISDEQSRTQTGTVLGSPNFMSPEQIEGLKPSHKTDLFSLGGVFYYCLTGKMPFTGPSIPVTMRNICDRPHPSVTSINPSADPALVQLVDNLLQKAPESRGEGARWLSLQLRSYLSQKGIVDIVEQSRTFISGLGLGSGNTIMEPLGEVSRNTLKSGSRSLPGKPLNFPGSASGLRKTGMEGTGRASGSSTFQRAGTNATHTTGAMGPSSRSPMLWIGVVLSVCILVLAGVILWTKIGTNTLMMSSQSSDSVAKKGSEKKDRPNALSENQVGAVSSVLSESAKNHSDKPIGSFRPDSDRDRVPGSIANKTDGPGGPKPVTSNTVHPPKPAGNRIQVAPSLKRPVIVPSAEPPQTLEKGGFVLIKSAPPFAALTINGKPIGETPMPKFLEVPLGKCHIEIVHRLHPPFDTTINVVAGMKREIKFKLDR